MKILGLNITWASSKTVIDDELKALHILLKEEKSVRLQERKQADANAARLATELEAAKKQEAARKQSEKHSNAATALVLLNSAERYQSMLEAPGTTVTRKAALNAIVVEKIESVKGLGFDVRNVSETIGKLELLIN